MVNKGVIPSNFHPTQYCLNSYSDNSRFPLAVVEGDILEFLLLLFFVYLFYLQPDQDNLLFGKHNWCWGCKNKLGTHNLLSCIYKTRQWGLFYNNLQCEVGI